MYMLYFALSLLALCVASLFLYGILGGKLRRKKREETPNYCEREGVYCLNAPHNDACEKCQACLVSVVDNCNDK